MVQIRTELRQIQIELDRLAIFYGGYGQVEREAPPAAGRSKGFLLNNNFAPLLHNGHKAARR